MTTTETRANVDAIRKPSLAYFATRPSCGHLVAASVIPAEDSKAEKREQAKTAVAGWVTDGLRVETLDVEESWRRVWCPLTCPGRIE